MNALVFLYKRVLERPLEGWIDAARSTKEPRIPVVLTREEIAAVLPLIEGTAGLIVRLLYGSGLRITEAVRLRVLDVDFGYKQISVRSGKGNKDRVTTFPTMLNEPLQSHLHRVQAIHERDLAEGYGGVYLPNAIERQRPNAAREWRWQYVFPASQRAVDPRSKDGKIRRHHIDQSVVNKAIKKAVAFVGLQKRVSAHTFPQLCDPSVGARNGYPDHSGPAGPQGRGDNDDLHARLESGGAGRSEPIGRSSLEVDRGEIFGEVVRKRKNGDRPEWH